MTGGFDRGLTLTAAGTVAFLVVCGLGLVCTLGAGVTFLGGVTAFGADGFETCGAELDFVDDPKEPELFEALEDELDDREPLDEDFATPASARPGESSRPTTAITVTLRDMISCSPRGFRARHVALRSGCGSHQRTLPPRLVRCRQPVEPCR